MNQQNFLSVSKFFMVLLLYDFLKIALESFRWFAVAVKNGRSVKSNKKNIVEWTCLKISKLLWKLVLMIYLNIIFVSTLHLKVHSQVWDNFWQLKTLKKLWKMLFIPTAKLFLFSRYLTFCLDFFSSVVKRLD